MMIHSTRTTITPRTIQPVVDMAGLLGAQGMRHARRAHYDDLGSEFRQKRPQAFGLGSIHRTAVRGKGAAVRRLRNHGDLTRPIPVGSWGSKKNLKIVIHSVYSRGGLPWCGLSCDTGSR